MELHIFHPLYGFKPVLDEIAKRPNQVSYLKDVMDWLTYIQKVKNRKIRVVMVDDELNPFQLEFEYPHRWRDIYRDMVLAKLYKLETELKKDIDRPYTLMSLTTYQAGDYSKKIMGGYTIPQSFDILAARGRNLMNAIRIGISRDIDYLWTVEPHKFNDSGYPHRHYMINDVFTDDEMKRITNLWAIKYRAGSREHGIDFSYRITEGNLKSLRNYVMSYLAKSLSPQQLTPGEIVFHAIASRYHYRFFGSSWRFAAIMKRDVTPNSLKWIETRFLDEWGDPYLAHRNDDVASEIFSIIDERMAVKNIGG